MIDELLERALPDPLEREEFLQHMEELASRSAYYGLTDEDWALACDECGCLEGELHRLGCFNERCPWCGGQLASCGCAWKRLGVPTTEDLTENSLLRQLKRKLSRKGRVPHIQWPLICARCGDKPRDILHRGEVGQKEWDRYVQIEMREAWLCRPCYDNIKRVIDGRSGRKPRSCSTP